MTDQSQTEKPRSVVERFMGGHPVNVILRLALISLVVGFLMSVFGFSPQGIIRGAVELFREVLRDGFGVFRDIWAYIVTGAVLVVPVWVVIRAIKAR
ncbi:DUF6460 domain-containing protein [Devosia ginsengisoli]|uniref:DUF6460 domain-containing protein n=1 Tax=Devosia ginsengisoli TaxID=400770 RepID=UPI0026EEFA08|nr:DUF6460 domain-containing protein [Devosia ginsengisoli]MCR6670392.1 DUF6460 domain-containing protein [Devosia ginsengisoli]